MMLSNLHYHIESLPCRPHSIPDSETMKAYKVQVDHEACEYKVVSHTIVPNSPNYQHYFGRCMLRSSTSECKYNLVQYHED
jgi:hypothetical protein